MGETNYVIINSRFRNSNSPSTSDFTFNLGESIEVSEVAIKSVSMINAVNPITKKLDFVTTTPLKYKAVGLSPLAIVLGFGDPVTSSVVNYYPIIPSSNVSAPFLPSLEGENNYHIVSSTLGQGQGSLLKNNDKRPIILTIPCNVNFGDVINYEVNEINLNKRRFTRPINIQDIDIKIIDDNGDIVDLGNTQVELVLQIVAPSIAPYSIQGNQMRI